MNRRTLAAMVVIAVMSIGFFQGQTTDAQPKDSPIVGSWRRLSGESGVGVTNLYTFSADGTIRQIGTASPGSEPGKRTEKIRLRSPWKRSTLTARAWGNRCDSPSVRTVMR